MPFVKFSRQNRDQQFLPVRSKTNLELTVITHNVMGGVYADQIVEGYARNRLMPDIACFQEFSEDPNPLSIFKKYFGIEYGLAGSFTCKLPKRTFGVAVLYNKKLFSSIATHILRLPNPPLRPQEKIFSWLLSGNTKPYNRTALVMELNYLGRLLTVVNVHLSWEGGVSARRAQVGHIFQELEKLRIQWSVIFCGDFNMDAGSNGWDGFQSEFTKRGFRELSKDILWTHDNASRFAFPEDRTAGARGFLRMLGGLGLNTRDKIDYIFVKDFGASITTPVDVMGSDHWPIVTHLMPSTAKA